MEMWKKSKVTTQYSRQSVADEQDHCDRLRSYISQFLDGEQQGQASELARLLYEECRQGRHHLPKGELAYLLMERLDQLSQCQHSWQYCIKLLGLLLMLTNHGLRDVIVMLKNRNSRSLVEWTNCRGEAAEKQERQYWNLCSLLLRYLAEWVRSYHLFQFETTLEEELVVLKLLIKDGPLLTSIAKDANDSVKEVWSLLQKAVKQRYESVQLHISENLGRWRELDESDFRLFYSRYEKFMAVSKILASARWYDGDVLEVERAVNQLIEFRYRELGNPPAIARHPTKQLSLSASSINRLLKAKLSQQC